MYFRNMMATPNFDRVDPTDCVYGKIRRLDRIVTGVYMKEIRSFGLRGSMLSMLFVIGKMQQINQKEIGEKLVLDASTVSRDIKKMIQNGWVKVEAGEDARERIISLRKEGYRLLEEVSPVWSEVHAKVIAALGQFSIQQIDQVSSVLRQQLGKSD